MTFKFVHTADVHIQKDGDEGFDALAEILKLARSNKAAALFIAGDLFDSDKAAFDVRHKIRGLFEDYADIKIFLVPGNHDGESYDKSNNFGSNTVALSARPFDSSDVLPDFVVYSIPFQKDRNPSSTIKEIEKSAEKDSRFPILITHGTLIDESLKHILIYMSKYEKKEESFYLYGEDFSKSKIPMVLLGHYHDFAEKKYGGTTVTYSGSPLSRSAKNTAKRRASLITVDIKKMAASIECIPLSSSYSIARTLKVVPGSEDRAVKEMESLIEEMKDTKAYGEIKIEGYTSVDEKSFQESLESIERKGRSKFRALTVKNETRQISAIRHFPLVENFLSRWEDIYKKSLKDDSKREICLKALELALEAFEETLLKKK